MPLILSQQEFQFLQAYSQELYESATLRTGPMGDMIISVRSKIIGNSPIDLTDSERRFLLFSLNDTLVTSHSSIVKSQLGSSMQFLRPDTESKVVSQIDQDNAGFSGTYLKEWEIIQNIMTKLGLVAPPPYKPLVTGPDGDPGGISTPMHHDINDGTMYNHR